jgi:chromosome segregation ATPase
VRQVYVANIVPGGSADRSGVIRVNDVIVKVDDQDVQGQPLSTLRNLILGKQGSYVVLAFRRMTGSELYYFDVELLRGTPEYFESLKKSQAIAEEKEKLINQVRQQEAEIHQLKQNTRSSASSISSATGGGVSALQRELMDKTNELRRLEDALRNSRLDRDSAATVGKDAEQALGVLRSDNKRLSDTLQAAQRSTDELQRRIEEDSRAWGEERQRLEQQLSQQQGSRHAAAGSAQALQAENARLGQELSAARAKDAETQRKIKAMATSLGEAQRAAEESSRLLSEATPAMESLNHQFLAKVR